MIQAFTGILAGELKSANDMDIGNNIMERAMLNFQGWFPNCFVNFFPHSLNLRRVKISNADRKNYFKEKLSSFAVTLDLYHSL